ncbi:MAG: YcxB family protein [Pirellula sp.]|nr:YcxB family protein [Pirellula sp.]
MSDFNIATFLIPRDEYICAIRRHYRIRLKLAYNTIGALIAIAFGVYLLAFSNPALGSNFILLGATILGLVVYVLHFLPSKHYRRQSILQREYRTVFNDNGRASDTTEIGPQLKWPICHSWLSDEEYYILFHGAGDLFLIPKGSMSEDDRERFELLLGQHIASHATK